MGGKFHLYGKASLIQRSVLHKDSTVTFTVTLQILYIASYVICYLARHAVYLYMAPNRGLYLAVYYVAT